MTHDYAVCMGCGQVFPDEDGKYGYEDKPSQCCGSFGDDIFTWPETEIKEFLKIVHDQSLTTPQGQRVAIIFLSTALEALLESELTELVYAVGAPSEIAKILLESNWGRVRMIRLFNQLSEQLLDEIFTSAGFVEFTRFGGQFRTNRLGCKGILHLVSHR